MAVMRTFRVNMTSITPINLVNKKKDMYYKGIFFNSNYDDEMKAFILGIWKFVNELRPKRLH